MIRKNVEKGMRLNDDQWRLLSVLSCVVVDVLTWVRLPTVPADRRPQMKFIAIAWTLITALSAAPYYLGWWRRGRRQ